MSKLLWGGQDPFTHTIIVGPTRCGKTATLIKPIIYQILLAKAKGFSCGLSVIEPKGDVAQFTVDVARELGIKSYLLDPTQSNSDMINLMKGPVDDVAEATIAVLKGMFGKQEAFFQLVQELTARNFIKLLKINHGDNLDIVSVLRTLRDEAILDKEVKMLAKNGKDPDLHSFYTNEMKGRLGEKWKDLALGLRAQIENIVSNESLKHVITGDSGIDLDQHMAEGGVLGVNTALGKLRRSGDAFGQFMSMHLQSAAFRRPGTEKTRIPHYLIIDEMSRYINADTEKFLSIAAEYRVAGIFAVQSFSQLEIGAGDLQPRAMKTAILTNCRNKICFGGVTFDDAEYFSKELGKDWGITRQNTFDGFVMASFLPKTYRDTESEDYRIRPTDIQDGLPRFHFIHKLVKDGHPSRPGITLGQFVPMDWKEKIKTINTSNLSKKSKAPQKLRGLFSLLKNRAQQPLKGGDTETTTQAAQRLPMDDRLNVSSESKKIVIKTKVKIKQDDSSSASRSESRQSKDQLEKNQPEKAPKNEHEERPDREDQSIEDQVSEKPFVFM